MNGIKTKIDPRQLKFYRSRREPTDPDELVARNERRKATARSWLDNPINEVYVRDGDFAIGDGNERVAGCLLLGVTEIPISMLSGTTTDAELDDLSLLTDFHKTALTPFEQATVAKRRLDATGMKKGELAEKLNISAGHLSKLLSVFECSQEVQDLADQGKLSVEDWYSISKSPNPDETLRIKRGGGNREALQKSMRKPKAGAVRTSSIKCPLPSGNVVTIKGEELSLEEAAEVLAEAAKALKDGIKRGYTAKTFNNAMKDMAAN